MDRFPYSIVWSPLPVITWFVPLIGHTGIADSAGVIHDFGGSYYIAVDHFTFGQPTKYTKLDPSKIESLDWDEAIRVTNEKYRLQPHNIITNNCHGHVADTLNSMRYNGREDYTQFDVFLMITTQSTYVSLTGFLKQWGFFLLLLILVILVSVL